MFPSCDYVFCRFFCFLFLRFKTSEKRNCHFTSLEAFVPSTATPLLTVRWEKAGDYWQNLYNETISVYLADPFPHIIEYIRAHVTDLSPEELRHYSLSVHAPKDQATDQITRLTTVKVLIPKESLSMTHLSLRLIGPCAKWLFSKHIRVQTISVLTCTSEKQLPIHSFWVNFSYPLR